MPGMNGPQVLEALRRLLPKAAFVMITGFAESELVDESLEKGAFLCLSKPLSISEIRDLLQGLTEESGDAWSLLSGPEES
jgi:two-component system response regulator (stage 0 sporulation protein F)